MPLAPPELAISKVAGKYTLISYTQNIGIIVLKPTLESSAISYQKNQLWNEFFALISLFSLNQFINRDI